MNVLERMKENDTERKIADFKAKQHQPYDFKVAYAETRVWEFLKECGKRELNCHVSVGGLDSITLCYFLKHLNLNLAIQFLARKLQTRFHFCNVRQKITKR